MGTNGTVDPEILFNFEYFSADRCLSGIQQKNYLLSWLVFVDGIRAYLQGPTRFTLEEWEAYAKEIEWVFSDEDDESFAFALTCRDFGIVSGSLRLVLLKYKDQILSFPTNQKGQT